MLLLTVQLMKYSCMKTKKVSAERGAHENTESHFYESKFYHIDNMSLDDTKEKLEWRKSVFEWKLKNKYDIEIQNGMTCIHDNKVNNIAKWNLLHGILNTNKRTKKYPLLSYYIWMYEYRKG